MNDDFPASLTIFSPMFLATRSAVWMVITVYKLRSISCEFSSKPLTLALNLRTHVIKNIIRRCFKSIMTFLMYTTSNKYPINNANGRHQPVL